jgi:hypothetical protein
VHVGIVENAFLLSELWEPSSELWEPLFLVGIMGKNGKCPVGIMGKYPSELWEEIVGIVGPYHICRYFSGAP